MSQALDLTHTIMEDTIISHDSNLLESNIYDNALPTYLKIKGFYPLGNVYEIFVILGTPTNVNPITGHTLTNIIILASWISEKVTAYVVST